MPGQQSICYEFAHSGRCRFNSSCKYSHVSRGSKRLDQDDRPQTGPTQRRPRDEHLAIAETELRSWKVNLPQDSGPLRPLGHRLEFFFQEAQRLIETNASILQEVIPCLAGESGLRRIQELIEQEFDRMPLATKTQTFTSQILPFLRTISHPIVLSSLVLEHAVGTICNVLFGHGGRRTIRLFSYILDVLAAVDPADKLIVIYLEHSLAVFSQILDINSEAFIQEPLKGAAKRFAEIFIAVLDSQDVNLLNEARKYLERIERRLEIGSSLPTARPATVSTSTKNNPDSPFTIHSDPPGGRHDNDFKDISEIKILPTFQEILCPRAEYLPVKDPAQWHLAGVDGLLDRNFRLLREDTIGQLRDAIQPELEQLLHPKAPHRRNERPNQMRTYVYSKAKVVDLCFDRLAGFQFGVEFPQPFRAVSSANKRQEWWQISKRMLADALVCVVDSHGIVVFCTVLGFETAEQARARQEQSSQYKRKDAGLWKDEHMASVYLSLVESNSENVRCILQHYQTQPASSLSLVEFPGVLLPAFRPTLRALQQMKTAGNLPFSEFLAPTGPQTSSSIVVPPPEYALKPGFGFNLRCLMNNNADLTLRPGQPFDIKKLLNNSTLDDAQAIALVNTLQRRIGLIQGPPGTGKSFTGIALVKVLLANKKRANIGPLICVCYTNHALDQLLEGLLDDRITSQIVRIGSRSRSERLAPFNLRRIGRDATKTKFEKRRTYDIHRKFDNHEQEFTTLIRRLNARDAWSNVEDYLMENHSDLHLQLFGVDEDGFQKVGGKNPESIFKHWLQWAKPQVGEARSLEQLRTVNLDDMTIRERRILYQDWLKETKINLRAKVTQLLSSHRSAKSDFNNIRDEIDLRCLSEADVIGVTTTGLARNLHMLRRLSSKVVLCEEAGEVLEAHLLTALLPSVEHAILIGDHLQLRPKIQNFELSRENRNGGEIYSLDVSLFERLVNPEGQTGPKLLYSTLRTQRRMHPSIAQLIRETLYPRLHDAPAVFKYPQVTGIRKRLFWIDHTKPEVNPSTNDDMSTSHYNEHEIDMAAAIIKHLISQGTYKSGDIALLTPYLGQLQKLRRRLSQSYAIVLGDRDQDELEKEGFDVEDAQASSPILKSTLLENLRVATIDNFQGEEAKIVVVSLVRSNEQNRCGFLRTSNRINVLLSRAKHGMYIIGNSRTSSHVQMWGEIVNILQMSENFGTSLELQCPRHPNNPIAVSEPDHFLHFSPEGGCDLRCVNRLPCGHACVQKCHSDMLHNAVFCMEPCLRPQRGCRHPCPRRCGDPCPEKCHTNVFQADRVLPCKHSVPNLPCWQTRSLSEVKCRVLVKRIVSACKHETNALCCVDVEAPEYACQIPCGANLQCGHTCKRRCSDCLPRSVPVDGPNHGICKQECGRKYTTCLHACKATCHGDQPCPPCALPCEVRCGHSRCFKKCREPCSPCAETKCLSGCPHSACSMPCSAPCDHIPCSKRCNKKLACGHRCPSVCGEACPERRFCQLCGSKEIKDRVVDFILGEMYRDIDLDENPCIFPRCGHFSTMESMDALMDIKKYYVVDHKDKPIAIAAPLEPFSMNDMKTCATCRGSLRDIARYGRLVRRALLDESTKKLILYINGEYVPLAREVSKQIQLLNDKRNNHKKTAVTAFESKNVLRVEGTRDRQAKLISGILNKHDKSRWHEAGKLRLSVQDYCRKVAIEEQPFNRVRNLVDNARRQKRGKGVFHFDESVLQTKGSLLAMALSMQLDIVLLADFLSLREQANNASKGELKLDLEVNRTECHSLINAAAQSRHFRQQVEGYIFLAQLYALESPHTAAPNASARYREKGHNAISDARRICATHSSQTRGLVPEIDATEKMLRGTTFYSTVSTEERMVVITAMSKEFTGTGHWYYCQNGHPFTIGECGMPMQLARCPECQAPVGGRNHEITSGVRHANDIEGKLENMRIG